MAISDDLRSVQNVLGDLAQGNEELISLLCDNLKSIADQVEALEALPLSAENMDMPVSMLPDCLASRSSGSYIQ